jgi:hypothetical protein
VIWWRHYGPANFLWFSDIALIGAVPAMWLENSAIASVLAVAVLIPELLWNVDYALRLLLRRRISGLTDYMFERDRPLKLRALSLFHVPLPLVLFWLLAEHGYAERIALPGAMLLAAIVLPWSRVAAPADKNINWTHGWRRALTGRRTYLYSSWLLVFVFLPTHWLPRGFSAIYFAPASRKGLTPRPTCLPGQGGARREARMRPEGNEAGIALEPSGARIVARRVFRKAPPARRAPLV